MLGTVGRGGNAQASAASGALMPYLMPVCFCRPLCLFALGVSTVTIYV